MDENSERWTEEDDARVIVEGLPEWHPSLFVHQFRQALLVDPPVPPLLLTEGFVTPESAEAWGDYSAARGWAKSASKISTTAHYGRGATDVAYVRLVFTDEWIAPNNDTPEHAVVTLVWRPDIEVLPGLGWRIHAVGEALDPQTLPRTAIGFDPRI